MLTMTQIHDIRKLFFKEGKNISQISKETGYDRKTSKTLTVHTVQLLLNFAKLRNFLLQKTMSI